jgi:threo-3-hydroxy-L-aspartate ammonia-lyase
MLADSLPVTPRDVASAAATLNGSVVRAPVLTSLEINLRSGAQVYFKCENFQRTGAFKFRGAYNAISRLTDTQRRGGVVAYSSGNHAQGIAQAAQALGVKATVVMPNDAPRMKMRMAEARGVTIVVYNRDRDDHEAITRELAHKSGATIIASSEHPDVIAGQGTVAKELIEEVGPLDYLFVPVGGGGLLAGSAIATAGWSAGCTLVGVEPEAGNDAQLSLQAGKVVHIPAPATIADGARHQHIGALVLPILRSHVERIVPVTDDQLRKQMQFFVERMKLVAEPTGCLAAAAMMSGLIDISGVRVGVLVTGGNVGACLLREVLTNDDTPESIATVVRNCA